MAGSKKISKGNLKKIFVVIIALMLIGGLVLSATFGLIDFLLERKNMTTPEEDYVSNLKEKAQYLEAYVRENPDILEGKADLGSTYYEIAMYYYYWELDMENVTLYAKKAIKDISGEKGEDS